MLLERACGAGSLRVQPVLPVLSHDLVPKNKTQWESAKRDTGSVTRQKLPTGSSGHLLLVRSSETQALSGVRERSA